LTGSVVETSSVPGSSDPNPSARSVVTALDTRYRYLPLFPASCSPGVCLCETPATCSTSRLWSPTFRSSVGNGDHVEGFKQCWNQTVG
jgi:hypothetical protein